MKFQLTIRGIVFSALFAALLVVFGFVNINLGFTPVPITLATLAIMFAGAFLGAGYGFFSVLVVIVLATLGLPFIGGSGGLSVIIGPSAGFVWSWPFSALLIGWLTAKIKGHGLRAHLLTFLVIELFGSLIMYVTGVPWLAHVLKISVAKAMLLGCYPYLPGDVVKAVVATLVVVPIRSIYPASRLVGHQAVKVVTLD